MKRKKLCIICGKEHNNPFPYCSNECWLEHGRRNKEDDINKKKD